MSLTDLVPTLQLSIGPVILISGIGLLLLSMTNRLGRVIDRARILSHDMRTAPDAEKFNTRSQLKILARRAKIVRVAIALAALSVLLAALLVISLFVVALLQLEGASLLAALFVLCLIALIASLGYFISDINLSILWLEMPENGRFE